jgi:uncharacterized NAD(P)/FAD-binding protein YdhS
MRSPVRTIAIIGGGFSGTVLAAALLRHPPAQACRIVLIERREQVGRGVAYCQSPHRPLLNVPAERMSVDPDDALQFVRFAQRRDPRCAAHQFLPRELYGEYLQDVLQQALGVAPSHVRLQRIHGDAVAMQRIDSAGPYLVGLADGQHVLAGQVVLACGDPPPVHASAASDIADHPACHFDPHSEQALRGDCHRLLLIGTGLTMTDVAIAAATLNPDIRIDAISRHGLLPAVQTIASGQAGGFAAPDRPFRSYLGDVPFRARALLQAFRALLGDLGRAGGDWRDAVNAVRQDAPALWRGLPADERARFLRHLRVYWDVHRHRMPPEIGERLNQLQGSGRLRIHAGHIVRIEAAGDALQVRWRPRGERSSSALVVDRLINCAGADRRLARSRDPLVQQLMAAGLAVADPLGLGWRTGAHGALIGHDGLAANDLFYLGPMLRAEHWEATAVGELRVHAQRLAAVLAQVSA